MSEHGRLIDRAGRVWEVFKDYWDILRPMRFCVLVLIGITLLILLIPQSQDALLALMEDLFGGSLAGISNFVAFAFLVFLWAFQTFYWARFVSRLPARTRRQICYPPPVLSDADIEERNERIPRRLGALVLFSVWLALLRANWWTTRYEVAAAALTIVLLVGYFWLVRNRRVIASAFHRRTGFAAFEVDPNFYRDLKHVAPDRPLKLAAWALALPTLALFLASGFWHLPSPRGVASAVAIVWIIFGFWAAGHIEGLPRSTVATLRFNFVFFGVLFLLSIAPSFPIVGVLSFLTSAPIIISVAAAWVFVGTFFLALPGEILRLPIASLVVLFAIIASVIGCSDNHTVRVVEGTPPPAATPLNKAFEMWWKDVPKSAEPVPLVLVATAGGGSRAAYWTTKVLGQLELDHPGFYKHIFAISSVSGGSLGAVVYRTMLNDVAADNSSNSAEWWCPEKNGKATKHNLVHCGLKTIDNDFLGPTFLTGLYADLTQRFLPGSLFPDRAGALERSWETAWQKAMPASSLGLDAPFHSLWSGTTWLPALIINGTSEKTGRRIITSNLLIEPDRFTDAIDFFTKVRPKTDIPVSTAAHNSARFPYIDAAGTLITAGFGMTDRIVDGGYFENFGAGSIYDLLRALNSREIRGDRKIKFFVIQITSDPELEALQAERDISWQRKSPFALNVASDVTAPPVALFNTGSALGFRATEVLKGFVNAIGGDGLSHYTQFRLTDPNETLSWVLSRKAIASLNGEWGNNSGPYAELRAFMKWN
jgi:hypothetical protein